MTAGHVGFSIVATDVGGGFSIGLGGLGFTMGLAGSWLLFTGLVGAWMAAVLIVPKIKRIDTKLSLLTFPDFLRFRYGESVAAVAAVISGVGYLGFTSAQILAGAKLASSSVFADVTIMDPLDISLYIMAGIILIYTVLGGLKAVIYTDTVQWIILLFGLLFFGIPFAWIHAGGWSTITQQLPHSYFQLTNISWVQFVNWFFTIVPIWFIAMTLYQRIYSCRDVKTAKRAFYIAGILEYPFMAFIGVFLGMIARIYFPQVDAEMGMPLLLSKVLPIGITGIVMASYFSAIMSTADSCLLASSGNIVNDLLERYLFKKLTARKMIILSQVVTLMIGAVALILAKSFGTVLEIILHAYSFMVAGLLVPTIAAYFYKNCHPTAALASMLSGGILTMYLIFSKVKTPYNLDASIWGIMCSAVVFIIITLIINQKQKTN